MLYTTFTVKGNDYKCRLSAKACVDLERKMGTNPLNVFTKIAANSNAIPNLEDLIVILHASMQAYNHKITMDDVYGIYDEFVDEGNTMLDLSQLFLKSLRFLVSLRKKRLKKKEKTNRGGTKPSSNLNRTIRPFTTDRS